MSLLSFASLRMALREIQHRPIYAVLFALSIAVGMASLMALAGVSGAVKKNMTDQAKELWTADVTVKGSEDVLNDVEDWARRRWDGLIVARSIVTLSMAQHRSTRKTGLVTLSAVSMDYPLYGKLTTASGRPFHSVLKPGSIVIGDRLAKGWQLGVGDSLKIGSFAFSIADVVVERTDVPTSFFELSPAVFLSLSDLAKSNLMVPGSRASNTLYLNLPPGADFATSLGEIKARASSETTEVASWATDNPGILKFVQRTILYMDFLALLTLTLGGIGVATALSAALNAGEKSVGMIFALGAPRGFVYRFWGWWVIVLAAGGLTISFFFSRVLTTLLLSLFGDLLPVGPPLAFPIRDVIPAAGMGLGAGFLFAAWPLLKLGDMAPQAILSEDVPVFPLRRIRFLGIGILGFCLFFLMAYIHIGRAILAFQYVGILAGIAVVGGGGVVVAMGAMRRGLATFRTTSTRLAARGLARPGHLNDAVVFSVALSLSVLVTLFLLEKNIFAQLIDRFPTDAPNAFFINIQPNQSAAFKAIAGNSQARLFPLIRGRVVNVNGIPVQMVNHRDSRRAPGDSLTREFGFTFGEDLLPTDTVVEGTGLWDKTLSGPQVSVFEEYKKKFGLRRGDRITIGVLGRQLKATVSSFRSINQSVRQPFFYFYFRPGLLDDVPHTLMTGLKIPREDVPELQNRLADALPNVTVIDLSDVAALTGKLFHRLGRVVRALGIFGLSSGILLLLSSLLASLASRTRESALFRVLGASPSQITRMALLEYAVVATTGVGSGYAFAMGATALLLHRVFELRMDFFFLHTGVFLISVIVGIILLSWALTRRALGTPPMEALSHE